MAVVDLELVLVDLENVVGSDPNTLRTRVNAVLDAAGPRPSHVGPLRHRRPDRIAIVCSSHRASAPAHNSALRGWRCGVGGPVSGLATGVLIGLSIASATA